MKTDLTYLKEMSAGNKELVLEMVDIFKSQVVEYQKELRELYNNKDWVSLGKLAHKAKASISMMGLNELAGDLKRLEMNTKLEKGTMHYINTIDKFEEETNIVLEEIEVILKDFDSYF
ncbi:MAG: Hpt domain-containing protein [Bacteroidales bacterium]|nr:Hpt domain-containing protein [Bacteroidales bacterium]